jgi:tRNA (guanine37-N1)-methyltransferase
MSSALDIPKPTNINSPIGNTVHATCLKVPREEAESIRKKLLANGLLDISRRIGREGDHVLLPLVPGHSGDLGYEVVEAVLEGRDPMVTDYREVMDVRPG